TPAVPMEASVPTSTTPPSSPTVRLTPATCDTNTTDAPTYSAVPSMFTVAPSGNENPYTPSSTPMRSAARILTGRVPLLERDTYAVTMASLDSRKKRPTAMPNAASRPPYNRIWMPTPPYTTAVSAASDPIASAPVSP